MEIYFGVSLVKSSWLKQGRVCPPFDKTEPVKSKVYFVSGCGWLAFANIDTPNEPIRIAPMSTAEISFTISLYTIQIREYFKFRKSRIFCGIKKSKKYSLFLQNYRFVWHLAIHLKASPTFALAAIACQKSFAIARDSFVGGMDCNGSLRNVPSLIELG